MDAADVTSSSYRLPQALEPWRDSLELFPEDLRDTIGAWLPKIARALGASSSYQDVDSGEPDGFSGIAQRGPYERLLMSEWALAELYPDEFLRRAAMEEQSFYQLAYQEPSASKRVCVLLDAGPEQLGGPRLVQLALLIVIANRAASAETAFEWGVLQERTIHKGLSGAGISAFLESRSCRQPGDGDFEVWTELLAMGTLDESWTIGGNNATRLAREHGASSVVRLDDLLDPETPSVCIDVVRGASVGTTLGLRIPPTAQAVRLVRDPLGERPVMSSTHSVVLSKMPRLCFSKQRHRLLALSDTGGLVAFHVPGAPGCKPGHPKHVSRQEGETIVAAQVRGRRISTISITHDSNELVARGVFGDRNGEPRRFDSRIETGEETVAFVHPSGSDSLCTIDYDFKLGGAGHHKSFPIVVDAAGNLFCWSMSHPTRQPEHIATDVVAVWPEKARYACATNGSLMVRHHALLKRDREEPTGAALSNVVAVDASGEATDRCAVCQISDTEFAWVSPEGYAEITLQPGETVQGIASHKGRRGIIVLDAARTSVYFVLPEHRALVLRFAGKALDTVLSPTGSHIAALSVHGYLQVYSFQRAALVLSDQVGMSP